MKKYFVLLLLILTGCTSQAEPTPNYVFATVEPVSPGVFPVSDGVKTYEYIDPLKVGAWQAYSEAPSEVSLTNDEDSLIADFDTRLEKINVLSRGVNDISFPIDGFTISLQAQERPFKLLVGVRESDESWYHTTVMVYPEDGLQTFEIAFSYLILNENSADQNAVLDTTQIAEIIIVDASGFIGPMGKGRLQIEEVIYWRGNPILPQLSCSSSTSDKQFLVGADANFVPTGEAIGQQWFIGEDRVDPIAELAFQGVDLFRLRTWVGEEGDSRLTYATNLGLRAQAEGMQVAPVFFLTEEWADVTKQPMPEIWQELTRSEQADAVEQYTYDTAKHMLEAGIDPFYYEIGNEIDYGISGIFADFEDRDIEQLQSETWIDSAMLILSAQKGILKADPDARFMLHISQGYNPFFSLAFFQTMRNLGVQVDVAGLSFYPSSSGVFAIQGLCTTLEKIQAETGIPVVISEFAYPAVTPSEGLFGSWQHVVPGFPHTLDGQASYISAFLQDMRNNDAVIGVNLFEPAFYWQPTVWTDFALYDENGVARPGLGALTLP